MSDTKHTPTPWLASDNTGPTMQGYSQSSCVTGTGADRLKLIAGCFNDIGGDEVAAANAAFIVRAANSHDKLVAALRNIAEIEDKSFGGDWDEIEEARQIARAALAAAEAA